MRIKKFVLGGAALPGGLRRAVKRARGDKGGATTFTVPTPFAVLAALLSSGLIVGLAVGLTEKGSRDSPRGWAAGTAAQRSCWTSPAPTRAQARRRSGPGCSRPERAT